MTRPHDSVLYGEILEHLTRPDHVLSASQRLCKSDGRLIIRTPFGHLRHPEHVRTQCLRRFLDSVRPFFGVRELDVRSKCICCPAPDSQAGSDSPYVVTAERLMAMLETSFDRTEQDYLDQRDRRGAQSHTHRDRIQELSQKLAAAQRRATKSAKTVREKERQAKQRDANDARLEAERELELTRLRRTHSKALDSLYAERERTVAAEARHHAQEREKIIRYHRASRKRLETAHAAELAETHKEIRLLRETLRDSQQERAKAAGVAAALQTRLSQQADQLFTARAEICLRQQEVRYRLGDAFVSAYYHTSSLIRLPHRTIQLFVEGRRRIRERKSRNTSKTALLAPPATRPATAHAGATGNGKLKLKRNGPTGDLVPASPAASIASPAAEPSSGPIAVPIEERSDQPSQAGEGPSPQSTTHIARSSAGEAFEPARVPSSSPQTITFEPFRRRHCVARLPLNVAAIMDEFTYECFRDECHLVQFERDDWRTKLLRQPPQLLLVESAWKGNGGAWKLQYPNNSDLRELVSWCKKKGIPTAFWNKEDPPNFDRFIDSASLFDHIFTSDENCIPRYRQRLGHDRVYALPFAAQPTIHNPIDRFRQETKGNVCFAGTYYRVKYPQRRRDIETLLRPAQTRGLTIFDRQHAYTASRSYRFPNEYQQFIQGGLSYLQMIAAYKAFHIFLNVNSVRDSPTMFSRRVLELLACGTAVISSPSVGMRQMLGTDAVASAKSEKQAAEWLDKLIQDTDFRERMVICGQRRVFCEHTYEHRMRYILDTIGIQQPIPKRRVSIITVTNRPSCLDDAVKNYLRQAYPEKEWIVVLNSDDYNLAQVKEKLAAVPNTRVFQRPQSDTLGACLNHGVDQSQFEFVAKFDDDDYYAEHFLTDMINAFLYSGTEIVGKRSYFAYLAQERCLALRFPGYEHRHTPLVCGATMVVRRDLFEAQRFSENIQRGVDTDFQRRCADRGFNVYAGDRFNFVANRMATGHEHTWAISDQDFLKKCSVVGYMDDYRRHVTA